MAAGNISSEKIDLLVYGPIRPILENGFSDQFVLHKAESRADLERLTPDVLAKTRGMAVTYHTVPADAKALAHFPKLEIIASFGVGYDHVDCAYAREHNVVVTNTPDVLTEEVADVAMGLLISTLREFVKADRYLRSGLWQTQNYPLSVGSLRDRKIGIVGMGRIGQAIGRRLEASRVPVSYHSRNPSSAVSYKHYGDLMEMAKAVDTLIVIVPGGAATSKMINADVLKALGPRGVLINVARGSVVDEQALVAALKSGTILAAGLDVFANEPNVPDELKAMQNVVLLPHIGSASVVTRNAMDQLVVDNLKNWFAGKAPLTPVAGNAGEGALMSIGRAGAAIAALSVLSALVSPARSQDASTLKKDMVGQWELATTERSKTCVVTLKPDTTPQGMKLELEPSCAAALPFTKEITAWNIKGLGDIVRMQDAAGQPVIDFTEVESGIFEGLRHRRGRLHPAKSRGRPLARQIDGPDDRRLVDGARQWPGGLRPDAHQHRGGRR